MPSVIVCNLRGARGEPGGGPGFQDVRCDRQSILGNPFPMGRGGRDERMRDVCADAHAEYLEAVFNAKHGASELKLISRRHVQENYRYNPFWMKSYLFFKMSINT